MRVASRLPRSTALALLVSAPLLGGPIRAAVPPGQPHVLTVDGQSTVTFVPQAGIPPVRVDYQAKVEYVVHLRTGPDELTKADVAARRTPNRKGASKAKAEAPKVAAALDLAVHSSESHFNQNGQPVVESKLSRGRFQGRIQPDAPIVDVSAAQAPPRLQQVLRIFDATSAVILLDEESRVIERKFRNESPLRALVETLLSIQTPVPRDAASWEAPTQLAMGHGQTARGTLRFEKQKGSQAAAGGPVRVKVSGVLKAEGVAVGRLIKDGTYDVTGDQEYDPETRVWKAAKWSVAVENDLANPNGVVVAHAKGNMTLESKAVEGSGSGSESPSGKR
ncbi:MAG: hypothetical protein U0835_11460 [Isosphaeraceae bacterium]